MSQISLVIPVFNQLDELKNLIEHLSNQKLKPSEIIIVDSSDDLSVKSFTESIEADFEIVYFYKPKKFGTSKKSKLGNILGPSAGQIANIFDIMYDIGSGGYNHYTARNVRRLIPFQNVWYLDWLFDDIEKGLR